MNDTAPDLYMEQITPKRIRVKEVIVEYLLARVLVEARKSIQREEPHCWRCRVRLADLPVGTWASLVLSPDGNEFLCQPCGEHIAAALVEIGRHADVIQSLPQKR